MSSVIIEPSRLNGCVTVPPSKSAAHRAILCAAMAKGVSSLSPIDFSSDITATVHAVKTLGASVEFSHPVLTVDAAPLWGLNAVGAAHSKCCTVDCCESGSTLRFLIPVAAAFGRSVTFTGQGRLPQRPIGVYLDCLPKHGVACETAGGLPLTVSGQLTPGRFEVPGNISSQFITGLLLALPLLQGDSELVLTSPLESAGYVEMTCRIMRDFGVTVEPSSAGWSIPGNQSYLAGAHTVEGDWSQAAFFLAAGALCGDLELTGLDQDSCQGDRAAEALFRAFGAQVCWKNNRLAAEPGTLGGITIDAAQIPDLVPILAATASLCRGTTRIIHAERLRIKESDRLRAMANALNALGGRVTEMPDGLLIEGVNRLHSGKVDGCNDHRIVMAMAIAALRADGPVEITDAESIRKSYPSFFGDYNRLGGKAHGVIVG